MCGVTGFWSPGGFDSNPLATLQAMMQTIEHRGPDDAGTWLDPDAGIALGHRRLAILDLSPTGRQPMVSASGRWVIVLNGEIYNWRELRKTLSTHGFSFRGTSDTEVMLAAFEHWGVAPAIQRFAGMFAFALWDRTDRRLYLARDRFGEKPMYYGWCDGTMLFGSELRAIRAHPHFVEEVDRRAVAAFLRSGYVPSPLSVLEGVTKLAPATLAVIAPDGNVQLERYWRLEEVVADGLDNPMRCGADEVVEEVEARIRGAVREQMVADVPVGAFLSGGVDSSTVVALMQRESRQPVRTFSIGFAEARYNEASFAAAVAAHLGTSHTEIYLTPAEALAVIPRLPQIYDEPLADPAQIPAILLADLARQHVTVALTGDGGDEVFGGYNRYVWGSRAWSRLGWIPSSARSAFGTGLRLLSPQLWDWALTRMAPMLPRRYRLQSLGSKVQRLSEILGANSVEELYLRIVAHGGDDLRAVPGDEVPPPVARRADLPKGARLEEVFMYLDARSYLPDDILAKVDRAAMSASLETRAPFLDHRVVELAWKTPLRDKIDGGIGKLVLRRMLARQVPTALTDRPKMGLGVPIDEWLRGPLRDWAEDLLDEGRMREEGFLDVALVQRLWREHLSARRNWTYPLWDVLMLEAWLSGSRASLGARQR